MFKPIHCRTARAALDWTIPQLAEAAQVNPKSVQRFEKGSDPLASTRDAIERALYEAGIRFRADGSVWHKHMDAEQRQDRAA